MNPELMRLFAEDHIARTRPASVVVAGVGLVLAGLIVARMSIVFLLPGLFVGGAVLLLALLCLGAGLGFVLLGWWIFRGYALAWYVAILSPLAWLAFSWWVPQVFPTLSTALLVLLLAIQPLFWRGSFRRWIFRAYSLRSRGFDGVMLPAAGPFPPHLPREGEAPAEPGPAAPSGRPELASQPRSGADPPG